MGDERRAEKAAGSLLKYDYVAGLRLELLADLERFRVDFHAFSVGGGDRIGLCFLARLACGVEDGNFQRASESK